MKSLALISVSDKSNLERFARSLVELGFDLVSTGGTARALREFGLPVQEVSELTGSPEVLDGRVKTLHPKVFAAVLADRDQAEHRAVLEDWRLPGVAVVAVNLYPFAATAARPGVTADEVIENIDIGGPSLIRAAAKNHRHVTVLVDPGDYDRAVAALRDGADLPGLRRELAAKAFRHTAAYDATIAARLPGFLNLPGSDTFAALAPLLGGDEIPLRYGENPHQRALLVRAHPARGLAGCRQLQGKELSYNNLMDTDAAWRLAHDLPQPGVAIIKHANPCGVAVGTSPAEAFARALACDPVSAFGGVIASSTPLDADAARAMTGLFTEVVIAPDLSDEAREIFAKKKNLRVLLAEPPAAGSLKVRPIDGGALIQSPDEGWEESWQVVTERTPTTAEMAALQIAWRVAKHTLSNSIVAANENATLGIGGGMPSRVDSCRHAVAKAGEAGLSLAGAAAASDAFFPFPDGLEVLAEAGVTAVVQPGGSVRDADVIAAANARQVAMVFSGRRHFRH